MVGSGRLFELKSRQVAHSNLGSFPPRAFSVEPHAQRYAEAGDGTETPGKNHSRQPEKPRSKDARQRDSSAREPAHARHNALAVSASLLTAQTIPTRQPRVLDKNNIPANPNHAPTHSPRRQTAQNLAGSRARGNNLTQNRPEPDPAQLVKRLSPTRPRQLRGEHETQIA